MILTVYLGCRFDAFALVLQIYYVIFDLSFVNMRIISYKGSQAFTRILGFDLH